MTSVLPDEQLRAVAYMAAKGAILVVLAIWVVAASAGAFVALVVFWPFLSVIYLLVWPIARFIAHDDTSGWGISVQKRPGRLRRTHVGGTELPLGKRVFVAFSPEFSIELAAPRWLEAVYLLLWVPFILAGPLVIGAALFQLAGREEPQVVVEWSWLPIGVVLLAGFYVGLVACVSWGAREFVGAGDRGQTARDPTSWARALHRPPRPMRGRGRPRSGPCRSGAAHPDGR